MSLLLWFVVVGSLANFCIGLAFTFIAPHIEQLLAYSMFRRETVLYISLKERLIAQSSFEQVSLVILVELGEGRPA